MNGLHFVSFHEKFHLDLAFSGFSLPLVAANPFSFPLFL
jgi:hypothetical protein